MGACDAEDVALGVTEPLGLVLAVPLREGELLGDSVRAWLEDAVAAWLRDADNEGGDDAVSVTERVRDSLRVAVIEGERVLVGELDAESEGVPLPDPLCCCCVSVNVRGRGAGCPTPAHCSKRSAA